MPGDPRSVQRRDPSRHRAVEDGGVHNRGNRFQTRLHHQDRRAKAPAHSQALGLWNTVTMIADSDPSPDQDVVTDSELWRIDQICDGFETVWKSQRRPRIEGFLE